MKFLYALVFVIPCSMFAQTTWPVEVGGSTSGQTPPYYDPQFITIEVGDIVEWGNVSGTHNVTGTLALYPNNPEGFSSGDPASGPWTFSHTFTIPGFYEYRCTQQGHGETQFGSITVMDGTGLLEQEGPWSDVSLFPVPVLDLLTITIENGTIQHFDVFGTDGRVFVSRNVSGAYRIQVPTGDLNAGHYYVRLHDEHGRTMVRPFQKN